MELCSFGLKSLPLCCLMFLRISLHLRQSLLSNLVREKTIVLFVSDFRHCCQRVLCHVWNYTSLL